MVPGSVLLLCVGLTCLVSGTVAVGGFECSLKHICDYETRKCKHVTICEEYDDGDNSMQAIAMAVRLSRGRVVRMPGDFVKFDTNADRVISPTEFVTSVHGNTSLAQQMFVEADTNGDHGVTCVEFKMAAFWSSQQKQRQTCHKINLVKQPRTIQVK